MLEFILLLTSCTNIPLSRASTDSPLPICSQAYITSLLNEDFCKRGDTTVFKGSSTQCSVSSSTKASTTWTLKPCLIENTVSCPPSLSSAATAKHTTCKYKGNLYSWDKKENKCKVRPLPGTDRTNYTTCSKQGMEEELKVCPQGNVQSTSLSKMLCVDGESNMHLNPPERKRCRVEEPDALTPFAGKKVKTDCPVPKGAELEATSSPRSPATPHLPPIFDKAIASSHLTRKDIITCLYKGALVAWDGKNVFRIIGKKRIGKKQPSRDPCKHEVVETLENILDLALKQVDTTWIPPCPKRRRQRNLCYYMGDTFRILFQQTIKRMICRLHLGTRVKIFWEYCNADTVQLMANGPTATKDKAYVAAEVRLKRAIEELEEDFEALESTFRNWLTDTLDPFVNATVQNLQFETEPGTSRGNRETQNANLLILRKRRQTSEDTILAKFTVAIDSRQVQGIDFAAELERNMKENAHKFDGPGGNFQIDPSSIQVQEVNEESKSSTSADRSISSFNHTIVSVISVTTLLAIVVITFIVWRYRRMSQRYGKQKLHDGRRLATVVKSSGVYQNRNKIAMLK